MGVNFAQKRPGPATARSHMCQQFYTEHGGNPEEQSDCIDFSD